MRRGNSSGAVRALAHAIVGMCALAIALRAGVAGAQDAAPARAAVTRLALEDRHPWANPGGFAADRWTRYSGHMSPRLCASAVKLCL